MVTLRISFWLHISCVATANWFLGKKIYYSYVDNVCFGVFAVSDEHQIFYPRAGLFCC